MRRQAIYQPWLLSQARPVLDLSFSVNSGWSIVNQNIQLSVNSVCVHKFNSSNPILSISVNQTFIIS